MNPIWFNAVRASARAAVPWYLAGGAPMPLAAYQPIGAASLADSYLRIAGTGGNANLDPAVVGSGVAPAWSSTDGWIGSGTQWLNTGIFPTLDQTWSMLVRFSNFNINAERYLAGLIALSPERRFSLGAVLSTSSMMYDSSNQHRIPPLITSGVIGFAGRDAYRNGVLDGSASMSVFGVSPAVLAIMARGRTADTADFITQVHIQALAIYSSTLTAPQVAAVSAAMAAL